MSVFNDEQLAEIKQITAAAVKANRTVRRPTTNEGVGWFAAPTSAQLSARTCSRHVKNKRARHG